MKIYVASSWRCKYQPIAVKKLRAAEFEVYDFRNPKEGDTGFAWRDISPDWEHWSVSQLNQAYSHLIARAGFESDFDAMKWADICLLVLPCGRSAHLEAGWFIGQGKPTFVWSPEPCEPELMYKLAGNDTLSADFGDVLRWVWQLNELGNWV